MTQFGLRVTSLLIAGAMVSAVGGCGGGSAEQPKTKHPILSADSDCVDAIKSGLQKPAELDAKNIWYVRSSEHKRVYFIVGRIKTGSETALAAWSRSGEPGQWGPIMSLNDAANEHSSWPDASRSRADISADDKDCVALMRYARKQP